MPYRRYDPHPPFRPLIGATAHVRGVTVRLIMLESGGGRAASGYGWRRVRRDVIHPVHQIGRPTSSAAPALMSAKKSTMPC